ncbi:MAG: ABC transporter permease [Verrucomicrobiota bacterium]
MIPILFWCLLSYVPPFAWHPDVKLEISAEQKDVKTVYTAGDRIDKEFMPSFQEAIRAENQDVLQAKAKASPIQTTKRVNQRILRQLASLGIENGFLSDTQKEDDKAIYALWQQIAVGSIKATRPALSSENLEIIQKNWTYLSSLAEEYDYKSLPEEQLLKLIPQGKASNPVYLPAPHEIVKAGIIDFFREPTGDKPWMYERFLHSLKIVFGGFLLSCLIGVPLGVLCGTYDFFSRLFEPFIDFFRYMPAPAFSTLLVAIFMAYDAPKIALVFIGTFFQMVLVISKTTRQLDCSLIEAAQTLGAKDRHVLGKVIVPGILPNLYNDLRILLGWSWTWLVIAELVGVKTGLTEFIETQGRWRNFERVFPVIISIGLLGFFTDQFLSWLRVYLFPWHYKKKQKTFLSTLFKKKQTESAA